MINFKMTLDALGTLASNEKLKYLRTLLIGEALHQFDDFCAQFLSTTMAHFNQVILGLGAYFFPVNAFSIHKHVMRRVMSNPRELKFRCYTALIIDIN